MGTRESRTDLGLGLVAAVAGAALVVWISASTPVCAAEPEAPGATAAAPAAEAAPPEAPPPIPRAEPGRPKLSDLEVHERGALDTDYVYGITKGVLESTMPTAVQVLFLPVTIVLDTALLPFELVAALIA